MKKRELSSITSIIIHCTDHNVESSYGRSVTVDDIRRDHLARGFDDIGYHYVVGLDGSVYAGRPLEFVGAHCKGFNLKSIGVAYIGGRNNSGYSDTRTYQQISSMLELLTYLVSKFPNIKCIAGHNEFNRKKLCPCFDARFEYEHLIGLSSYLSDL